MNKQRIVWFKHKGWDKRGTRVSKRKERSSPWLRKDHDKEDNGSQEDKLIKLWTLQEGLYTTGIYPMTHP